MSLDILLPFCLVYSCESSREFCVLYIRVFIIINVWSIPCTLHYHINHQCTCAMETHVSWLLTFRVIVFFKAEGNIEEKLLLHVAIVAKCLDDNIPKKTSLKLFQTSWSDSFKMLVKFSAFEFKRTISKFRIRERKFFCCVHLLHKVGAWNEEVSCHIHAMTVKKF